MKASPYVALATSVCVAEQDIGKFKELLNKALAIDIEARPQHRLANILTQRKARWLLDHIDNYFLLDEEDNLEGVSYK
jgi:predicted anti-sigma-YlaC factor YlaD